MRFLRTNTATRITVGPFFDKTTGVDPETSITVTSCKLTLTVDDAGVPTLVLDTAPTASGGANDMVHITGDDAGFYDLELAAGNVNYVGRAMLAITDAAVHCPVFHEFMILPANVYDSLVGGTDVLDVSVTQWLGTAAATPTVAGVPEVDVTHFNGTAGTFASGIPAVNATQISGDSTAADNAEAFFDGTGYAGTNNLVGSVNNVSSVAALGTGAITAASIATDAIDADALATDAVNEIRNAITGGAYDLDTDANGRIRVVDGTAAGEINTASGVVQAALADGVTHGGTTADLLLRDLSFGGTWNVVGAVVFDNASNDIRGITPTTASKTGYALSSTGMDSVTLPANLITATSITNDAITADKIANGAIDAATFAAGAINAAAIATDAIDNDAIAANAVTEIQSGLATAASLSTVSTNVSTIQAALILSSGVIGSTGNDATHIHLPTLTYGDDEINDYLLVIIDDSAGETHARWVSNWVNSTGLATVATLPFTPENAADLYYLLCIRQDVTGGSGLDAAGVRAAIGMASANLDTQLSAIVTDTAEIGAAGAGLTAIQLPSNGLANVTAWTVAITGNVTGNLSGSVASVTGAINTAAGTITTLDALDTAQDTQHSTTQTALTTAQADLTQIKADLPTRITKNTELAAFPFTMVLTSDHVTGATSKTVTATRSIDGGAFASCANAVSEIANGWYKITLAAADLNGNTIALRFTATDCDDRVITIVTQP